MVALEPAHAAWGPVDSDHLSNYILLWDRSVPMAVIGVIPIIAEDQHGALRYHKLLAYLGENVAIVLILHVWFLLTLTIAIETVVTHGDAVAGQPHYSLDEVFVLSHMEWGLKHDYFFPTW